LATKPSIFNRFIVGLSSLVRIQNSRRHIMERVESVGSCWRLFGCDLCNIITRGSEGFLLDLGGLRKHSIDPKGNQNYFLIPSMGKVKGEHHDRCHLLPCTFATKSGIKPYLWIERLKEIKFKQGLIDGPGISDEKGRVLNSSVIDQGMHEVLEEIYGREKELFPSTIKSKDDIASTYHAFRSFRRSSDTRALNQGVRRDDIDLVNRWHQVEKADGSRPSFDMRHHYAQYELLVEPFLRYTSAM
jgi:hypothetical protein